MREGRHPAWLDEAIQDLLVVATSSQMVADANEGEAMIVKALDEFAKTVTTHDGDDRVYFSMLASVAFFCISCSPHPLPVHGMKVINVDTGTIVSNPDQEVAGDPNAEGMLGATRLIVAAAQDDQEQFVALFDAFGETGSAPWVMIAMVRTAGAMYVQKLKRSGKVPPEWQEPLALREKRQND